MPREGQRAQTSRIATRGEMWSGSLCSACPHLLGAWAAHQMAHPSSSFCRAWPPRGCPGCPFPPFSLTGFSPLSYFIEALLRDSSLWDELFLIKVYHIAVGLICALTGKRAHFIKTSKEWTHRFSLSSGVHSLISSQESDVFRYLVISLFETSLFRL